MKYLKLKVVYRFVLYATIVVCSIYTVSYVEFPKAVMVTIKDATVNKLKTVPISKHAATSATELSRNLVFVKTHKTGSSYVNYLFERIHHNWSTEAKFLPRPYIGGYPGHIRFKYLKSSKHEIDAIIGHMRFDADELHRHMPKNTRYFSIIREPWSQFQSAFNYYGHHFRRKSNANCFHMPIAFVLNNRNMDAVRFMHECAQTLNKSVPWYFRFKNYQSHDLGFDPMLEDQDEIKRQIKALDENMDLVMINEYLNESLILLKDILQLDWSTLHFWAFVRKRGYEKMKLDTIKDKQTFSKLNNIDIALYDHFNATFWRKVESYGRKKMEGDLLKLKEIRSKDRRKRETDEEYLDPIEQPRIPKEITDYMLENSGGCLFSHD